MLFSGGGLGFRGALFEGFGGLGFKGALFRGGFGV